MALKLGRAGLDIPLREPMNWAQSGADVSLSGLLTDVASWELRAQREQLLGLGHADEPVILVRSDSVPELDGLYRVAKVDVAAPPGSFAYRSQPWAAQLLRVGNWQQPLVETVATAATLPHGWGALGTGVVPTGYHFFPRSATSHSHTGAVNLFTAYGGSGRPTRPSSDGDLSWASDDLVVGGTLNSSLIWTVPQADYYLGDCRVEFDHTNDDLGWRRVLGRQVLNKPLQVRLNNGVVRLNLGTTTMTPSWWLGSAWGSAKQWGWSVTGSITTGIDGWAQVAILRNTPEECSIRLIGDTTNNAYHVYTTDITIKRGSRWVFVRTFLQGTSAGATNWQMAGAVNEAATLLDPGIHRTANDGSGNRWLLASDQGLTSDLTNGRLTSSSPSTLWGFGLELGGTGAVAPNTAAGQFGEWIAGWNGVMRPVGM